MRSICGSDCCTVCPQKTACGGCRETGRPPLRRRMRGRRVCRAGRLGRTGLLEARRHCGAERTRHPGPQSRKFDAAKRLLRQPGIPSAQWAGGQTAGGTTKSTWAPRSSAPARNDATALSRMKIICWCANTAAMAPTRRSSAISAGSRPDNHRRPDGPDPGKKGGIRHETIPYLSQMRRPRHPAGAGQVRRLRRGQQHPDGLYLFFRRAGPPVCLAAAAVIRKNGSTPPTWNA